MQLSPYNGLGIQYIFSKWLRWGYANDNLLALVTCDRFYVLFPQTYYFKSLDTFQVLFNLDVGGNQIPFLLFSNTVTAETILCSTDKIDFESSPLPTNCKCESKPNQTKPLRFRKDKPRTLKYQAWSSWVQLKSSLPTEQALGLTGDPAATSMTEDNCGRRACAATHTTAHRHTTYMKMGQLVKNIPGHTDSCPTCSVC